MPVEQQIDPDIFEIFDEEVEEVLAELKESAAKYFPITEVKSETYKNLRRGFHTIKGSGRMAGATVIGELAWAYENMLNHLGDGKIQPDPRMEQAVLDCIDIFPIMMTDLREQRHHSDDHLALIARAEAIIKGVEYVEQPATEPVTQPISEVDEDMALNAEVSAKLDEIYERTVADNAAVHSLSQNMSALEKLINSLQETLSRHATAIEFTDSINKKHDATLQEMSQYLMRQEERNAASSAAANHPTPANDFISEDINDLKQAMQNAVVKIELLESRINNTASSSTAGNTGGKWIPIAIAVIGLIAIAGFFV